ncbi:geminin coiled-coil domain-containing protein 1 isoform X2 [Rattus norvegicus]|uniref:geminin coiled-coil domain-containing protein 1 isoform X2 n=1 Tax=Rattus norvegicus TaxID=10116 RepID=UPI0019175D30|nr:geminin coiled-coil domain-containing protein 1 isoform X2 [Rattus norvegicus]
MNTILPCQDQYFVGGQSSNCPYSTTTSESGVDVSKETWVSFWAAGLLDNSELQQAPHVLESPSGFSFPVPDSCSWEETELSSQLYRNKQLQDTLLQKEEELARLHEENNHLRQYLNSTLVKRLEEKAKTTARISIYEDLLHKDLTTENTAALACLLPLPIFL